MKDPRTTKIDVQVGDRVRCNPGMGEDHHDGTVVGEGSDIRHTHDGVPYRWVTILHPHGRRAVFPTTRLS